MQIKLIEFIDRAKKDPAIRKAGEAMGYPIDPDKYIFVLDRKKKVDIGNLRDAPNVPDDVPLGLAGIVRFGNGEKSADVWFSLGVALGWRGDKQLAIRALRRAELLGHPRAAEDAELVSRTIHDLGRGRGREWSDIAKQLDAEFAKGTTWAEQQGAKEDALIRAGKPAQAFGY